MGLYNCGVSDEKFGALSPLTDLESLGIYCDHRDSIKPTDAALSAMKGLARLRSLSLNGTAVSKEGLDKLVAPFNGRYLVY